MKGRSQLHHAKLHAEELPRDLSRQRDQRDQQNQRDQRDQRDPVTDDDSDIGDTIRAQPRRGNFVAAAARGDEQEWSPAFVVGAFLATTFNQDVLLGCGATCSLVSPELASKALRENTKFSIKPEREMSVTGISGKSAVEGWMKVLVDLGKGVLVDHTLLICQVGISEDISASRTLMMRFASSNLAR